MSMSGRPPNWRVSRWFRQVATEQHWGTKPPNRRGTGDGLGFDDWDDINNWRTRQWFHISGVILLIYTKGSRS